MANNIQIDNKVYKERGIEFAKKYRIENGRVNFSHSASVLEPPDFLAIQKESYNSFLQKDVPENKRKNEGLQEVLNSIFPIVATNEKMQIEFISYSIGEPKISEKEARRRDKTYAYPFKIKVQLTVRDPEMIVEQEIFVGDIPAMTDRGTFIINGAERVVVSQIHRSPGVVFNRSDRDAMFVAKIIPERGTWLEFELDTKKDIMYVRIDRKKKLPVTVFLRAIGITTNEEILKLFYTVDKISLTKMSDEAKKEALIGRRSYSTVYDTENPEEIILNPGELINTNLAERLLMSGIKEVEVLNMETIKDNVTIINTLDKDATRNQKEACAKIYNVIRPGEPALLDTVVKICNDLVFDSKSYALGDVGRYKINKRLNFPENEQSKVLRHEDIIETIRFLIKVFINEEQLDDIDHLGNRRIRSVGELLAIQMKTGFTRLERIAKERMQMQQSESGAITPQSLVSIKLVQSVLKEFYGTSQLSQFMDQNNPLA